MSSFGARLILAALWLAPAGSLFNDARAQEQAADGLLIILDASNSMWGQIEGENKIVIARRVLRELLEKQNPGTRIGLLAYGHRREGDCEDVELVQPIAPLDAPALIGRIEGINPKGKTPITRSINEAVKVARAQDGATTIVLVSDGIETCAADPCAAVRTARAEGANFLLHVVGFDVGDVDVAQLECSAQAGGGLYISANNADELVAALNQAVVMTPETPAARLSVGATANAELTDAMVTVVYAESGEDVAAGRTYTDPQTNPRLFPLPVGNYRVTVRAIKFEGGDVQRNFDDVQIVDGEITERTADFSTGFISIRVLRNGALSDATVKIRDSDSGKDVAGGRTYTGESSNPAEFELTAGTYDVTIGSVEIEGQAKVELSGIVLAAGQRFEHEQEFGSGVLRVGAVRDGHLQDATVKITRRGDKPVSVASGRLYVQESSNPQSFELPPGEYDATVQAIGLKGDVRQIIEGIEVIAGDTVERIAEFSAGSLSIAITRNGELSDATVNVVSRSSGQSVAGGRSYTKASSNPLVFELTPGVYEVRIASAEISGRAQQTLPDITVEAGVQVSHEQAYTSGNLTVQTRAGGAPVDAVLQVLGADSRNVDGARTYAEGSASFVLLPGSYTVRGTPTNRELGGRQEISVVVGEGESVSETLEFGQ